MSEKWQGGQSVAERAKLKGEINSVKDRLAYTEEILNWLLVHGDDDSRSLVIRSSIGAIHSAKETLDKAREHISNTQ